MQNSSKLRIVMVGCMSLVTLFAFSTPVFAQEEKLDTKSESSGASTASTSEDYIVIFKKESESSKKEKIKKELKSKNKKIKKEFKKVKDGFVTEMSKKEAEELKTNPDIEVVEKDRVVKLESTETNAVWGLDRIDQTNLPLDTKYSYGSDGSGVDVFILDTGINANHSEFTGRVGGGYDFVENDTQPQDCNGHGTHVAGTVGGTSYGVAKKVKLHSVRVLGCDGSGMLSGIIQGIDWIAENKSGPAVVNMSLGSTKSSILNSAVQKAIESGVVFVVAGGNSNADSCNYSPSSAENAIAVGSTNKNDSRSTFSNYGSCIDIFAPGENIVSANYQNNSSSKTMSGTSMASPHVAGVAARYLSEHKNATPEEVSNGIKLWAVSGKVQNLGMSSPNLLLGAPTESTSTLPVPVNDPATNTPATTTLPVVTPDPATSTVASVNITLTKMNYFRNYSSIKGVISVKNSGGGSIRNAKVNVKASGGVNGSASFTTNQDGQVVFNVTSRGVSTFTVTSVIDSSGKSLQLTGTVSKTI